MNNVQVLCEKNNMSIKSCILLLILLTGGGFEPVSARRRAGRQRLPITSDQHAIRHEERRRKASGMQNFLNNKSREKAS